MTKLNVKILGTGIHLPDRLVTSEVLENELGYPKGTFEKTSGVERRYHVNEETSSEMGAMAAERALEAAGIDRDQLDAIISVSGVPQQAIPSTSALIHRKLGLKGTVSFDINSTCLSFLTGLFCLGHLIHQKVYRHVLLVSADVSSTGLNPRDPKTASLFGDGAAAVVLGQSDTPGILATHFETWSEHGDDCQCEGGGNRYGAKKLKNMPEEDLYFKMNGPHLFKTAMPPLLRMLDRFKEETDKDIDVFIPHQASPFALDLLQKKLKLSTNQFVHIVRDYGNMIATSIPFALHKAIENGQIQRGNRVLLFGTAAGLTIGGVLLEY